MTAPAYRLLARAPAPLVAPVLDEGQRRVVEHRGGPLLVLAGPGTGKTTTVVEAVVERVIGRGVPIEDILVLTFSQRAAGELRDRITARLATTVREPVARTFHSYAFGLLRLAADEERPAPRLLSATEQDVVIRELLAGDVADRRAAWPPTVTAALGTRGFAAELRDLLLRAAERGIGPGELDRLGRRYARPEWQSAAAFGQQYFDVAAQERPGSYDAAELIQAAITALETHPDLLARERSRRRHVFVDEYQDTDPAQTRLLALLGAGARELVVVGDPDQSIYAFRGADPQAMRRFATDVAGDTARYQELTGRLFAVEGEAAEVEPATVALTTSRRCGATLLEASRRVAGRLPGPVAHRRLSVPPGTPPGHLHVRVYRSAPEEAAAIAAELRRAHLYDGLAWSQMAVIVRSTTQSLAGLRRALLTAGVPVGTSGGDLPLAEQPAVSQLLTALACVDRPAQLKDETAEALLLGAIGGADGLYLRRLRRHLQGMAAAAEAGGRGASGVGGGGGRGGGGGGVGVGVGSSVAGNDAPLLVPVLTDPGELELLPARLRRPARRVNRVLAAGRAAQAAGRSAEDVLWAIWDATGLAVDWERRSRDGGTLGAAADRDLDAVIDLFAAAARLADRLPGSSAEALYDSVLAQQVPGDTFSLGRDRSDAVQVVTAHASKGLEWEFVCVAGVQEGQWPDLRRRGSLLGSEVLVDVVAGRGEVAQLSLTPLVEEERRLFYVAVTRARSRLHVSAVAGEDEQPSRFLDEIDPQPDGAGRPAARPPRGLHLPDLVAELRRTVTDPDASGAIRAHAAAQLARLVRVGIDGADPASWWGLAELSDERGLVEDDHPVRVRPSGIESYLTCALKSFLEANGATESSGVRAALGSAVHEIAELADAGSDLAELERLMDERWPALDFGAPWYARAERNRASRMLQRLAEWLGTSRTELTLIGREEPFDVHLDDVELIGTVDRLEADAAGRAVVIDFKTGKSKPKDEELPRHLQLAAYQLAAELGGFDARTGLGAGSGGARLVQLAAPGSVEQAQPPLADQEEPGWIRDRVREVAALHRGHRFDARINQFCQTCPVRTACPLQTGQQVTT
ncbi:MAG: ATP-dependent DNA helicase [bacterium]